MLVNSDVIDKFDDVDDDDVLSSYSFLTEIVHRHRTTPNTLNCKTSIRWLMAEYTISDC